MADEMLDLIQNVENEIASTQDKQFAISVEYKLVFTKSEDQADITLAKASGSTRSAVVIDKPVDYRRTHPHFTTEVVQEVDKRLRKLISTKELRRIERLNSKGKKVVFTRYDFQAIVAKEGWKKTDKNKYHYMVPIKSAKVHVYSLAAIDFIVDKIIRDHKYLRRALKSYKTSRPMK